jgi:uncharacterized protein
MHKAEYEKIEKYMHLCMNDAAHDRQHVYRVLYFALDIAKTAQLDLDILTAATLLHDIGRQIQYQDSTCDHAIVGADMAYAFLVEIGWSANSANHVKACITTHRFRNSHPPLSMEAKVLFDADKLDVTGVMGIARTLLYKGLTSEPLYTVDENSNIIIGHNDTSPSFFNEYNAKLKNIYDKFHTKRASEIALERQKASIDFYESLVKEVLSNQEKGLRLLEDIFTD